MAALAGQRSSKNNGHLEDGQSPITRTGTPSMYNNHGLQMYPNMDDSGFQGNGLGNFGVGGTADGRVASPMNGEHPSTQESLLQENASLKTRVSELEVIQELYRGRLHQLEQDEQNARQIEGQLRNELEESHRRENMLKRRLDELELELSQTRGSVEAQDNERHAKRPRIDNNNDMASVGTDSVINNDDVPQDPALKDHPIMENTTTDTVTADNATTETSAAPDHTTTNDANNNSVAEDALQALKTEPGQSIAQTAT
jgi:GATA-binding protein